MNENLPSYESVVNAVQDESLCALFHDCIVESEGLSGRALRKLPFQAYALWLCGRRVVLREYLLALKRTIQVC